jgi:hypothetical protein
MAQRPPLAIAQEYRIDQIVTPLRQARLNVAGGLAGEGDGMSCRVWNPAVWLMGTGRSGRVFHARYLRNLAFWRRRLLALSKDASMTSAELIDINAIAAAASLWLARIPRVMHQEA